FPDDLREYDGYQDYFLSRRIWFFGFVALTELLDVVDTLIKGTDYLRALGPEYPIRIALFIILCGAAAATPNRAFHLIFVLVGLAYEIIFFVRHYFYVG
ncbi:MAG: hypothetical protein JO230_27330, partial [Xanthobacteraceae bacterium]|nr:hypothetical protein [Xanthobacteraceae bacterium]